MNSDHRLLIILIVNALLYFFVNQLNAALGAKGIYLSLDALYILFAALYFSNYHGLIITAASALTVDAVLPSHFGTNLIIYTIALLTIGRMKIRLRRENPYHVILIALVINLLIILTFTLVTEREGIMSGWFWIRLITDLFLSELVIAIIAPWYLNLQRILLLYLGIDLASELQVF